MSNAWEELKKKKQGKTGSGVLNNSAQETEPGLLSFIGRQEENAWEALKAKKKYEASKPAQPVRRTPESTINAESSADETAFKLFSGGDAKASSPLNMGAGEPARHLVMGAGEAVDPRRMAVGPGEYVSAVEGPGWINEDPNYIEESGNESPEMRTWARTLETRTYDDDFVGPLLRHDRRKELDTLDMGAGEKVTPPKQTLNMGAGENAAVLEGEGWKINDPEYFADMLTGKSVTAPRTYDESFVGPIGPYDKHDDIYAPQPGLKMGAGETALTDPQMIGYDNLKNQPDFQEVLAKPRKEAAEAATAGQLLGQIITNPAGVREGIETSYMSQSEKDNYDYLQGKYGQKEAEKYYRSIEDELNQRKGFAMYLNNQNLADWQRSIYEGFMPVVSGIEQTVAGVGALGDILTGDTQGRAPSALQYADMLLGEKLNEESGWNIPFTDIGWKKALHDTVQTTAAQVPQYALSFAGSPMLGMGTLYASAFGNKYNQARSEGLSFGQSVAQGIATAAIEGLSEKIGGLAMGSDATLVRKMLGGKLDDIANPILKALAETGLDAAGEGFEEALAGVAEPIVEEYVMSGAQDQRGFVDKLVDGWNSIDWGDVRYQGFLGAASGGMMTAPGNAVNAMSEARTKAAKAAAQSVKSKATTPEQKHNAAKAALEIANVENAEELADAVVKIANGEELTQDEMQAVAMTEGALEVAKEITVAAGPDNVTEESNKVSKVTEEPPEGIEGKELEAWSNRQQAISTAAKLGGERRIHEEIYDMGGGEQNAAAYGMEYERAYNRGANNLKLTDEITASYTTLNSEQVQAAWNEGRKAYEATIAKKPVRSNVSMNGKTGLVDATALKGLKLNANQRASISASQTIAEALGIKVVWEASTPEQREKQTMANGWYLPKDQSIHLDIYAGSVSGSNEGAFQYAAMRTFSHELTHYIQDQSPAQYAQLRDMVFGYLQEQGMDVEALIEEKAEAYSSMEGYTRFDVTQEVIADACEMMLRDSAAVKAAMKKDPSLWERIKEKFAQFVEDLRAAFGRVDKLHPEAKALMREAEGVLKYAEDLQKKWDEALLSTRQTQETSAEAEQTAPEAEQTAPKAEQKTPDAEQTAEEPEQEQVSSAREGITLMEERSWESIKDRSMRPFAEEAPEVREWFAMAAELLQEDLAASTPGQKHFIRDEAGNLQEVTGQKRNTVDEIAQLLDHGMTYRDIGNALDAYAQIDMDWIGKHPQTAKKAELMLDQVLMEGYTNIEGERISGVADYKALTDELAGRETKEPVEYDLGEDVRFSRREVDGQTVVWVDDYILADKPTDMTEFDYVESYLNSRIGEVYRIAESGRPIYIGTDLPKEYTRSKYTKGIARTEDIRRAKSTASSALGEMIENATDRVWEKTKHPHNKDAKYGIYKYNVTIAFEIPDGGVRAYDAELVIRNASDGNKYLYDVQKIKRNSTITASLAQRATSKKAHAAPIDSIAEDTTDVNEGIRYQPREEEYVSNRELLANALAGAAQTVAEQNKIAEYKRRVRSLDIAQNRVANIREEIAEINKDLNDKTVRETEKAQLKERLENLKAQRDALEREINEADKVLLKLEATEPLQKVVNRERKAAMDRVRAKANERRDVDKYKQRIANKVASLSVLLTRPTTKKYVPDPIRGPVAEFLSSISFVSKRQLQGGKPTQKDMKFAESLAALQRVMSKVRDRYNDAETSQVVQEGFGGYLDLPEGFVQSLTDLSEKVELAAKHSEEGYNVNMMSVAQLESLDRIITTLKESIQNVNKFLGENLYKHIDQAARDTYIDLGDMRNRSHSTAVGEFFEWENAMPAHAFDRFGRGGKAIFYGLMRGQGKLGMNANQVIDFANDTYTAEEARKWAEDIKTFKFGEEELKIPVTHIMSLYCLRKREQAQGHLHGEGIRVADFEHKGRNYKDPGRTVDDRMLDEIVSVLTDRQKAVADKLQEYMVEVGSEWGNEVSMRRFGYRAFEEKNYFPINSDGNHLAAVSEEGGKGNAMYALLNISPTKELTPKANNRLMLYNIFDVFANHMSDMAQYNAMALPLLDAIKWINYKESTNLPGSDARHTLSMQDAITKAYGEPAKRYVIRMLEDVSGRKATVSEDKMTGKMLGRVNRAAVAANLRVAVLQPLSLIRAGMDMDALPIVMGFAKNPAHLRENIEKMKKYSGIAVWKDLGFRELNISRGLKKLIKHDETAMEKVVDKSMALAEAADKFTWAAMWEAAEIQTAKKMSRSDEGFYDAVRDLFERTVYRTQVVDSVLTKSQYMRTPAGMNKWFGAFMSEPVTTYNMLASVVWKISDDARVLAAKDAALKGLPDTKRAAALNAAKFVGNAVKKNMRLVGRTFAVYSASVVATTMLEALMTAWRDDDDYEKFMDKLKETTIWDWIDNANPLAMVPVGSQMWDLFKIALNKFGSDAYGFEMTLPMADIVNTATDLIEMWNKWEQGKGNATGYGVAYKGMQLASDVAGLPFANAAREAISLWNNAVASWAPELRVTTYKTENVKGAESYIRAVRENNDRLAAEMMDELEANNVTGEALADAMEDAIKASYQKGDMDKDESARLLKKYAGYEEKQDDRYEAERLVRKWDVKSESGNNTLYGNVWNYIADWDGQALKTEIKELKELGIKDSQIISSVTSHFMDTYLEAAGAEKVDMKAHLITALTMLGLSSTDAKKKIEKWEED